MMKRIVFAAAAPAVLFPQPALSKAWTVGQQPVAYTTHTGLSGTPPALSYQASEVNPTDNSPTVNIDSTTATGIDYDTHALGAPGTESKFRFQCIPTHEAKVDSIVNPGQAVASHLHVFFGSPNTDKDSSYTTLRNRAVGGNGSCSGVKQNLSAYWAPPIRHQLSSGAYASIIADLVSIYYQRPEYLISGTPIVEVPRGWEEVGGENPSSFNNTTVVNEMTSAGTYFESPTVRPTKHGLTGHLGWYCSIPIGDGSTAYSPNPGASHQPYWTDKDGHLTVACNWGAGSQLVWDYNGPDCWDAVNLTSPDGRSHVRYAQVLNGAGNLRACPDNWVGKMIIIMKIMYTFKNDAELQASFLSSDRMNPSTTAGDPTSDSPCRKVGPYFCPGETAHSDWIPAWYWPTFQEIQSKCLAIPTTLFPSSVQAADCNTAAFGPNKRLTGGPASNNLVNAPESQRHFSATTGPNGAATNNVTIHSH